MSVRRSFGAFLAIGVALMARAESEGWDNVDPSRPVMTPAKVLWQADLSAWPKGFRVAKVRGAEGSVELVRTPNGPALHIRKTNDIGFILIETAEPIPFPAKTDLQACAAVSGSGNDPEYAIGYLRLRGKNPSLRYNSELDGRGPGGPKMDFLFNTPPGAEERKLCRFRANEQNGTNVTALIAIAGRRSDSTWRNWCIEDLEAAKAKWNAFVRSVDSVDHAADRQDDAAFSAALAADCDHTAALETREGVTRLVVDGRDRVPVVYKGRNQNGAKNTYCGKKMEEAGIDIQVATVRFGDVPSVHGWWSKNGFDAKGACREIRDAMRMAPRSVFFLTMIVDAYAEFTQEHPEEIWRVEDGRIVWGNSVHASYSLDAEKLKKTNWPWVSNHSLVWRAEVKRCMTALIDELKAEGLAKRIVGVHLGGYHDHQFSTRKPDYSRPAVEGFRAWQKRTYGAVRWETAPSFGKQYYLVPGEDDHQIAYLKFLKVAPFEMQEDLARHVKAAFGKPIVALRWCMAAFGGEFGGAYDIGAFARSDAIDILVAQPSYTRRIPGCAIGVRLPDESFHLNKKLFLNEFDLRTWGGVSAGESELRVLGLSQASDFAMWQSIYRKVAGQMIAENMGWWFYDMAGGWYEPPAIAADIADSVKTVRALAERKRAPWHPSAAFVIDEEGARLRNTVAHYYNHDESMAIGAESQLLAESGVPYDTVLIDDLLTHPEVASRYRVLVFGGLYHIDAARRDLLARLRAEGRTLVYLAGTGFSGGSDATGFEVIRRPGVRSHRVVAEPNTDFNVLSWTDLYLDLKLLGGTQYAEFWQPPRATIAEKPGVKVIARFDDGDVAIAERRSGAGVDVYVVSAGGLTPQHFNRLVARAGGYVATRPGVQVNTNGDFLSLHGAIPGACAIRLPRSCAKVVNLKTGRDVPVKDGALDLILGAGETRWYRFE